MKFLSTALLLLSSGLGVEAIKNKHGFDPGFLKAMNEGSKHSAVLRKVTIHERKEFWKNLLKKAKPATESNLRAAKRKLEDANGNNQNYNNGNYNDNGNQNYNNGNYNNGNGNQNYKNGNYNGNGNYGNYAQQGEGQQGYNYQNGNWKYGGNDINYNYNGNAWYGDEDMDMDMEGEQYMYDGYDEYDANEEKYAGVDWSNLGFDMKSYSLKYTGCSAVKTYDSNKAASDEYDTVLSTKRFALFRLCPSNNCNQYSVNGCGRNYGEYVLEMDAFLEGVVEFNRQRYWHYCHYCRRCNALESFGETIAAMSQQQAEYYEQMQQEAEAYYEEQQEKYMAENQQYGNENAANYQYYGNYGQNNQNNQNYANYQNAQYNQNEQDEADAEAEGAEDGNQRKLANNNGNNNGNNNANYQYRQYYKENQGQGNNANYQNQNAQMDESQDYEYWQQKNQNIYNDYFWNEDLFGEWNEEWSEAWLAFNWQVLPYCTTSELETCANAENVCADYDDDFQEEADAMGGFSACTQIDDYYYIGPHCNSDGYTITLGVYSDQYCDNYVGDEVSLFDVLGYDIDEDFDFFPQECVSCEETVSIQVYLCALLCFPFCVLPN